MDKQGKHNKDIEGRASDILLNKGLKFGIRWMGREWKFTIKPLYLGTVIKISKYAGALKQLDVDNEPIAGTLKAPGNLVALSKVVACGVLNSRILNRFSNVFAWWLRYNLTAKELNLISTLIVRQMSVEDFFFTTQLIGGINLLTTDKEGVKQSGEASPESQNNSDTVTGKSSGESAG
jgi:hypothetical protein